MTRLLGGAFYPIYGPQKTQCGPGETCPMPRAGRAGKIMLWVAAVVEDKLIEVAFECNDHLPRLAQLAKAYADREPDLADLCLIRMSELHPRHSVITVDREDFRVYRRNKRETLPVICPP